MAYETLPTAQQAIDEYMHVINGKTKDYVCSNCAAPDTKGSVLKLCSKCQTTHWKQHKYSCRLGAGDVERDVPAEYLAQKFAEHLMRVPWLITLIDMYAVVALGLDTDPSNATRSCLCARITAQRAPPATTANINAKPLAMLQFERFEIRPVSVLTASMRNALKQRTLLAGPNAPPPLLLYFSSDGDNFLFMPHEVLPQLVRHAANRPVFDDGGAITADKVISLVQLAERKRTWNLILTVLFRELNEFIRLDTNNVCKLRGALKS
ncbi:hypothetical protein B0H17DRAFT_1128765 [Mycena rosella]|uniref:MYND-type domain-containing protein n=1 Tax=Mycena rosella TaxID=1033263 RepID=A0AAD7DUW7_MYCRO|nr:hypothetical protein B0H17DRAFT_1128765 [Mycena rosella]